MPQLRYRSRSYRRTFKKTPGGKTVLHYKKNQIKKLSKTKKRPTRPYGGQLCSECSRRVFKEEARS